MGDLKPLGSEKLEGQDKIKRIIEISRYNENRPTNINETSRSEYGINLADGNGYQIVKERLGYIIKKTISESATDYIEPMKNRKYYSSYGQALKRLNLLTKEVNRLTENDEGTSLFGEQKKFVLKTPKSALDDEPNQNLPPAPAAPPEVPTPELPPSPESTPPSPEGGEIPTGDTEGGDMPDMGDMEGGDMPDIAEKGEEEVTFKSIQKLTGKLTQKMREFDNEKGLTSENIKYVINMVLSAADLSSLSEEDKEDIMSKFEEEEEDGGMGDMGDEDFGPEPEGEGGDMGGEEFGAEPDGEMGESLHGSIFDSIFGESKVDKVISKYFQVSSKEKRMIKESQQRRKLISISEAKKKMKEVVKLSETIEQELASHKFLEENSSFVFVGKTNKQNLVFENKNKQIRISPEGFII
jgi:hypothetical protein